MSRLDAVGYASLLSFEYVGCLLTRNKTLGGIGGSGTTWSPNPNNSPFFECPDVFTIGATGNIYMAIASLHAAQNEWYIGTITNNRFVVEDAGILDFGQFYAARS